MQLALHGDRHYLAGGFWIEAVSVLQERRLYLPLLSRWLASEIQPQKGNIEHTKKGQVVAACP